MVFPRCVKRAIGCGSLPIIAAIAIAQAAHVSNK